MMTLLAALDSIIAVLVVAVASPGIELCAIRDGKEAGSSEADVTASVGRVSATETGAEEKTFSVCEGDASVAKSRVVVGSTELAVTSKVKTPTSRSRLREVTDGGKVIGGTDGDTDGSAVVSMIAAETEKITSIGISTVA